MLVDPHVPRQTTRIASFIITLLTGKRLLASVNSHMFLKIGSVSAHFSANNTREFVVILVQVILLVTFKLYVIRETLVAEWTVENFMIILVGRPVEWMFIVQLQRVGAARLKVQRQRCIWLQLQ